MDNKQIDMYKQAISKIKREKKEGKAQELRDWEILSVVFLHLSSLSPLLQNNRMSDVERTLEVVQTSHLTEEKLKGQRREWTLPC